MNNVAEKIAFVKANKSLLKDSMTNAKIAQQNDEQLDTLIAEIRAHADFVEPSADSTDNTDVAGMPTPEVTQEFGAIVRLAMVKLAGKSVAFQYGDKLLYTNNPKVLALALVGKLPVGEIVAFKAESITVSRTGQFVGEPNTTATPALMKAQESVNAFNQAKLERINSTILMLSCTRQRAEEIVNDQLIAEINAKPLPKLTF